MELNFALSLSFQGISLLRAAPQGWYVVGEVALDTPDLGAALAALRENGGAGSSDVKIVIPNEQIRYLELRDPGGDTEATEQFILESLEGATPYAVADLMVDYLQKSGVIYVAAVAVETLNEALDFTQNHGFSAVYFSAIAPEGRFPGEVYFGPAQSWTGPIPLRSKTAIKIIEAPVETEIKAPVETPPPAAPLPRNANTSAISSATETPLEVSAEATAVAEPTPESTFQFITENQVEDAPEPDTVPDDTLADAAPEPKVVPPAPVEQSDAKPEAPAPVDQTVTADPAPLSASVSSPEIQEPTQAPPAFTSIRASRNQGAVKAPRLNGAARTTEEFASPAKPIAADNGSMAQAFRSKPVFGAQKVEPKKEEIVPQPTAVNGSAVKGFGFFSRRKTKTADVAEPETTLEAPQKTAPKTPMRVMTSALKARRKDDTPLAALPEVTGEDQSTPQTVTSNDQNVRDVPAKTASKAEREQMTIFGAREKQKIGGKPRFFGLMLTTILLLFLAGVAAWASVFLDEGIARFFFSSPEKTEIVEAELPDILGEDAAEMAMTSDLVDEGQQTEIASLSPEIQNDAVSALSQPLETDGLSDEQAETTYAATGIWQRTPTMPHLPGTSPVGEVYNATMDSRVVQPDAVVLQQPMDHTSDRAMFAPINPAPAGTIFELNAQGLVVATPKGARTPDGILIYAGKPPAIAPLRPADAVLLIENPAVLAERARMKAVRPRLRPDNVVEGNERARFAGLSLSELAQIRPKLRPRNEQVAEEVTATATKQAIPVSPRPIARPRNFAATVAKAEKLVTVAAVKPRTVSPSIPSSASVAKQATVKNAINMRNINLIGVYGKPSSRRALVRLANGKYKKVKVGDSIDGGKVAAIGESDLRYVKRGRNLVIKLPKG